MQLWVRVRATVVASPAASGWPVPGRRPRAAAHSSCCAAWSLIEPPWPPWPVSWAILGHHHTIAMEATTELLDAAGPARLHVAPAPRCAFRSLRSQLGQREKALTGMPGVRSFTPSTPAPSTAEVVEAFRIPAS